MVMKKLAFIISLRFPVQLIPDTQLVFEHRLHNSYFVYDVGDIKKALGGLFRMQYKLLVCCALVILEVLVHFIDFLPLVAVQKNQLT